MRRFTLLCDPARVKRGLREREELGPVLTAGRDYTLLVDRDWHDATGHPLAGELRKSFHVAAPDETPIDIVEWEIGRPAAGTRDPLVVKFPESLDHALLERMLRIVAPSGDLILGGVVITDRETRWEFTPAEPWQQGEHRLSIDTALEDLAGNAVGRPFDVDTLGPIQVTVHSEKVELPFTID